jgi:rhamnosyl/mannosyltransferase
MGGMETHLQALCGALRKSVNVRAIVASDSRTHREEVVDGVPVTRVARLFSLNSTPICPQMTRRIRATEADVVHIHLPNPTALISYLRSSHKGRLVLTWHSDIVRQKTLAMVLRTIEHIVLARSVACIATSPNYLESSPMLRAFRRRCRVVPYGISLDHFERRNTAEIAKLRAQHGPRIVLAVGRLIYYKGFEYLVRAMKQVMGKLVIVGDGPLRECLERDAHEMGIRVRIFFSGEIQNESITPFYHAADVFVLPSVARSEAFGIVQLEAMACGKPVVNTHLDSGVPFVSLDGITGITVAPCKAELLAAAINRLLDDPKLRATYGEAAARRVRDEFTVEKMARRTLEVYNEALEANGAVGSV